MMTSEMTMTMLMVAEFCKKNYRDRDSDDDNDNTVIIFAAGEGSNSG